MTSSSNTLLSVVVFIMGSSVAQCYFYRGKHSNERTPRQLNYGAFGFLPSYTPTQFSNLQGPPYYNSYSASNFVPGFGGSRPIASLINVLGNSRLLTGGLSYPTSHLQTTSSKNNAISSRKPFVPTNLVHSFREDRKKTSQELLVEKVRNDFERLEENFTQEQKRTKQLYESIPGISSKFRRTFVNKEDKPSRKNDKPFLDISRFENKKISDFPAKDKLKVNIGSSIPKSITKIPIGHVYLLGAIPKLETTALEKTRNDYMELLHSAINASTTSSTTELPDVDFEFEKLSNLNSTITNKNTVTPNTNNLANKIAAILKNTTNYEHRKVVKIIKKPYTTNQNSSVYEYAKDLIVKLLVNNESQRIENTKHLTTRSAKDTTTTPVFTKVIFFTTQSRTSLAPTKSPMRPNISQTDKTHMQHEPLVTSPISLEIDIGIDKRHNASSNDELVETVKDTGNNTLPENNVNQMSLQNKQSEIISTIHASTELTTNPLSHTHTNDSFASSSGETSTVTNPILVTNATDLT